MFVKGNDMKYLIITLLLLIGCSEMPTECETDVVDSIPQPDIIINVFQNESDIVDSMKKNTREDVEAYYEDSSEHVYKLILDEYDTLIFEFDSLKYLMIYFDSIVPAELFTKIKNYPHIDLLGDYRIIPDEIIDYPSGIVIYSDNVCASSIPQMGWLQNEEPEKDFNFCF